MDTFLSNLPHLITSTVMITAVCVLAAAGDIPGNTALIVIAAAGGVSIGAGAGTMTPTSSAATRATQPTSSSTPPV